MHGRMREHGAPAVDQGVGEGVAQEGWGLAGFGVGEQIPEEFRVGAFLVPPRVP